MAEWGRDVRDDHRISDVVIHDDVEKLRSYMRSPRGTGCLEYPLYRLEFAKSLSLLHAVNIATAMLEGRLGARIDVNEYNLLHHAARMNDPELVQLFLSHGARTDIRLTKELAMGDKGLLPLAIALDATRSLYNWTLYPRDQSHQTILNLIVTLCDPKMDDALASTKLIAGSSKDVEEEAFYCAMEGKLIDLAVLLIVAREKVLVPLTFPSEDGAGSTRRITIHQYVKDQIVTLIFEEIKLRREFKPEELTQVQRNIMVMRAIGLLLEVFEKAGSTIDEYRQSQKFKAMREQKEKDEKDLALRLEEAGFKFEAGDFHFSITDWFGNTVFSVFLNCVSYLCTFIDLISVLVLAQVNYYVLLWLNGAYSISTFFFLVDSLNSHDTVGTPIEHLETLSDESSQYFSPPLPLLQRTNVPFSQGVRNSYIMSSQYPLRTPIKSLEIPSDKSSKFFNPGFPLMQQRDASSHARKEIPHDGDRLSVSTHPLLKTSVLSSMEKSNNADQIAESISGSQYSAKVDVQVKKNRTKVIVQNAAKYLSREKLAYIARFIKR
ncbi:hypothetical protein RHGRI_021860 [Rhododendron griersonianum]|uniref:Ankyrin repeat family protein n=1 Tax=Rhododendron griersonianum TaxID=479676 RepID=A0AAV6JNG6_9ERIC|nr:hypothetical protein RHGRI_021860 [Rhododendron griersonianum]KAG5542140.1 hypothetical protein RHGRI_021860 [Rhododendron griersonianum]